MHKISHLTTPPPLPICARSAQKTKFTPEKYTSKSEKNMLLLYKYYPVLLHISNFSNSTEKPCSSTDVDDICDEQKLQEHPSDIENLNEPHGNNNLFLPLQANDSTCSPSIHTYEKKIIVQCLIMAALKYRHKNMTFELMEDVSKLLHVENDANKKITKHKFKKIWDDISVGVTIHHICNVCKSYVGISKFDWEPGCRLDDLFCSNCDTRIDPTENFHA